MAKIHSTGVKTSGSFSLSVDQLTGLSFIRYAQSDIEDLAFTNRSSRESVKAGLRVCIEHCHMLTEMPVEKQKTTRLFTGIKFESYAGAERDDEGMALKI
jgi:hypothetical protein